MQNYIKSPKSGRFITVKGEAYKALLKDPKYSLAAKSAPRVKRGTHITKGWGAAAPQRGNERHQLKKKCGSDCFLLPKKEAFPICASLRTGQGCKVDCRGIIAAKVRAGEWKYEHVKKAAQMLEKKYGC